MANMKTSVSLDPRRKMDTIGGNLNKQGADNGGGDTLEQLVGGGFGNTGIEAKFQAVPEISNIGRDKTITDKVKQVHKYANLASNGNIANIGTALVDDLGKENMTEGQRNLLKSMIVGSQGDIAGGFNMAGKLIGTLIAGGGDGQ